MLYRKDMVSIGFNNGLHLFLNTNCQYSHKLAAVACGKVSIPSSRRTVHRGL